MSIEIFTATYDTKARRLELVVPKQIAAQIDRNILTKPQLIWWGDLDSKTTAETGELEGLIIARNPE